MLEEHPPPTEWSITETEVESAVSRALVESNLYGLGGMTFELPNKVRNAIPTAETCPFSTIELRPEVRVRTDSNGNQEGIIEFRPVPQAAFALRMKSEGSAKELEEKLQKFLADRRQRTTLHYSVRVSEHQTRTAFPETQSWYDLEKSATQLVAVVSIPRQWLMESPSLPLAQIASLASDAPETTLRIKVDDARNSVLLFQLPLLLEAIREAFEDNVYGDWVTELRLGDQRLGNLLPRVSRRMSTISGPPSYFSPEQLAGENQDLPTKIRLIECIMADLHADKLPDAEVTFMSLLTNYDADFLLRGISDSRWQELTELTGQWGALWTEVISETYWRNDGIDESLVLPLFGTFRNSASKMPQDVGGWVSDALEPFTRGSRRVLRHAIERMQRFALTGLPLICAATRTEADLLRSWRSYLGQSLKGRIVEKWKAEKSHSALDEEVDLGRRSGKRPNRRGDYLD